MGDFVELYLTKGYRAKIDRDQWILCSSYTWHANDTGNGIYARSRTSGRLIYLHDLIMGFPSCIVDHKNRDPLDCRKENLRLTDYQRNNLNRKGNKDSSSVFKGVSHDISRKKWKAQLVHAGTIHLNKRYNTELEAAKAYDDIARRVFGEYAFLNFPEDKC